MLVSKAHNEYVRWLIATRDLSPHTIRAYDGDIAAIEKRLGTQARVDEIDRESLVGFLDAQRASGLSSKSLRRRASSLRGFCRWLVLRDLLPSDPWIGTTVEAGQARKLPRVVSTSDLAVLLHSLRTAAGVDDGCFDRSLPRPHEATTLLAVALLVATGVRVSELVNIDYQAVDLVGGSIRLVGKGRRERQVFLTNNWLTGLTSAYLRTRVTLGLKHSRLLFNRRREPLTTSAMRTRLLEAARTADLEIRVTPHMLRHTAATQLIESGVDIRYIQRLLGHASLTTTEIYTHVSDQALRRAVAGADVLTKLAERR